MNDPAGSHGLDDAEAALAREADLIARHFPEHDPNDIERRLHEDFDELAQTATVRSHLVTRAGATLTNELIAEGEHFESPTASASPPEDAGGAGSPD